MTGPPLHPGPRGSPDKTLLANVRVFDGTKISDLTFIVIDGDKIGTIPHGANVVNCKGGILIPGLIDCHVHVQSAKELEVLRQYGITTCFDMECYPLKTVNSLRNLPGLTDFYSAGVAASLNRPGTLPEASVPDVEAAHLFVAKRVAEGSDYIKIIADLPDPRNPSTPGLDLPSTTALVTTARQYNLLTIAHSMSPHGFNLAQAAGVDIITHAPLSKGLDGGEAEAGGIAKMVADHRICIPTLTMMQGVDETRGGGNFVHSQKAVDAMYTLGVPILAGTDCNTIPETPYSPPQGDSLHLELQLLVEAGMTTLDALRAATVLPPQYFRLPDRGAIKPGMRADLVLLGANPLDDIKNTRKIQKVWCGGKVFDPTQT